MESSIQKTIRLAIESALRVCDRVVVTHSIAPAGNPTATLELETWGVGCLASLTGEINRVVDGARGAWFETEWKQSQEITIDLDVNGQPPTRRELMTAVTTLADVIADRLAMDAPGRLVSIAAGANMLGVWIEINREADRVRGVA